MIRVGLTGGIASGKSTVARLLADRGAVVVDADQIARELVEPGSEALEALVDEFGSEILADDGSLARARLAAMAFADPEGTQRLNAVMHPRIREEGQRRIAAHPGVQVVVYDMPLLVETRQTDLVDLVVVVDVPVEAQIQRAVELRGLDEEDVRRRMQVQARREDRLAAADVVIDNSGSLAATARQVDELWTRLTPGEAVQS